MWGDNTARAGGCPDRIRVVRASGVANSDTVARPERIDEKGTSQTGTASALAVNGDRKCDRRLSISVRPKDARAVHSEHDTAKLRRVSDSPRSRFSARGPGWPARPSRARRFRPNGLCAEWHSVAPTGNFYEGLRRPNWIAQQTSGEPRRKKAH